MNPNQQKRCRCGCIKHLHITYVYYFFFFLMDWSLYPQQRAHSWVVEFQSYNRVHRVNRLCPSNVFNALHYIPCLDFPHVASYCFSSSPSLPSYLCAATVSTSLVPSRYIPSCYHHLLSTQSPGLRTVFSQRSRTFHIVM